MFFGYLALNSQLTALVAKLLDLCDIFLWKSIILWRPNLFTSFLKRTIDFHIPGNTCGIGALLSERSAFRASACRTFCVVRRLDTVYFSWRGRCDACYLLPSDGREGGQALPQVRRARCDSTGHTCHVVGAT